MRHAVRLALTAMAILLPLGCGGTTAPDFVNGTPPIFGFTYPSSVVASAYQLPAPGMVAATSVGIQLTNTGASPVSIEHGACSVAVWLYRAGTTGRGPAWENRLPASSACIAVAYAQRIAPGESYQVGGALVGAHIMGDSLPTGRYLVRVAIRHEETGSSTATGQLVVVDGGMVALP